MKITRKELQRAIQRQESRIDGLVGLLAKKGYYDKEPEPQLKQLDQSVFDGEPEQIKWAVVTSEGAVLKLEFKPVVEDGLWHWTGGHRQHALIGQYDTTDWQNSLIKRDLAKELAEVDLSSELTGSDLARAMLARGDKYVLCQCWDSSYADIEQVVDVINGFECTAYKKLFAGNRHNWEYATPINNQGEPLTASEVGL